MSEAEKLGKTALVRNIRGFDLCSVEAEYLNFIRAVERAVARSTDTERVLITAAHSDELRSVLQYIQENVIKENTIVQLSSLIYVDKLEYKSTDTQMITIVLNI